MLGTLMKYEFKSVGRLLLPLYGAWLVVALLLGISIGGDVNNIDSNNSFFIAITGILYAFFTVFAIVITIILLIQRFYKNLLGNEGYFMFALPVSTGSHITNKILSGAIWMFIATLVAILTAIMITVPIVGIKPLFNEIGVFSSNYIAPYVRENPITIMVVIETIIFLFVSCAYSVAKIYAAISVGHQWSNHRVLGAILAYIGFGIIESTITSLFGVMSRFFSFLDLDNITMHFSGTTQMHFAMLILLAVSVLITAIYWFVSWVLLNNKLNLE